MSEERKKMSHLNLSVSIAFRFLEIVSLSKTVTGFKKIRKHAGPISYTNHVTVKWQPLKII